MLYYYALLAVVGLVVIKLCCDLSPHFQYKFKFLLFMLHVPTWALLTIPFFFLRPKDVRNMHWLTPLYRTISPFLGIKWEIHDEDKVLENPEPCVLVCNHQSSLDILAMAQIAIPRTAAVAKKELLYAFPFGLCAWLCGTVFINRADSSKAREQIDALGNEVRRTMTKLWIFPEGTRHKGDELLPFKKGAFHIAVQHKLPIVPIVISPYHFVDDEKTIFNSGKMIISVLPPISTTAYEASSISELVDKTRDQMNTEYKRLSKLFDYQNNNTKCL